MERSDGKNPLDPETYSKPAPNIQTMLELRAFCADFFHDRVRRSAHVDEEDITSFLALILHSPSYFARAHAVIPELQLSDAESSMLDSHVKVFVCTARGMMGPQPERWDFLPEEPAWAKLVQAGMNTLANDSRATKKHLSDATSDGSPMSPTVLSPLGKDEDKPSDSPPPLPMSVESNPKYLPKLDLSNIPTFVPRNAMGSEELVWSPTSGTRQRRPDETYHQQSTKASSATPRQFGQGISPNVTSAYSIKSQYLFHGSRDFSDSPTKGHRRSDSIRMSPPPQFRGTQSPLNPSATRPPRSNENSNPRRRRHDNSGETSFPGSIDRMMEMTTLSHNPNRSYSPSPHADTTAYPVNDLSRTNPPSQFRGPRFPPSQARDVYSAEPFSAASSFSGYGDLHQTGQGIYRGPPSQFQGQLDHFESRPDAAPSHAFAGQVPFAPNPSIWTTQSSRPHQGALPNQMPDQIIHPVPRTIAQAQLPPFIAQPPSNTDNFTVPPPGSMPPLDYWNLLHQRETEIRTRLQNANRPMTTQEHQYISLLGEARINAAATQMPARGNMSKGKWLTELGRTLRSIWKMGPRGTGFGPVIVARKVDFEQAIEREIALVSQEKRFGGGLGRAYGA